MWIFPTPSNSPILFTLAVCPINLTQFSGYVEIASDPTGQVMGSVPQDCPPFRCRLQVQMATCTSDQMGFVTAFENLLEWLTEPGDILTYIYWFSIKWYNSETTIWKRCIGQGVDGGKAMGFPSPLRVATLLVPPHIHQTLSLSNPVIQEFW